MKPYNRSFRNPRDFKPFRSKTKFDPIKRSHSTPHYERPRETGLEVIVENDNIEKAIRRLKKKVDREGLIREIRDRSTYSKPSEKRKIARQAARDRWLKYSRDRDRLI
jgi:small subunit ribosomal protein S21